MFFCCSNWFFCDVNEPNTCCRRVICFTSRYQCDLLTKVVKENSVKNHSKLVVQDKSLFTNVKLPRSKLSLVTHPRIDRLMKQSDLCHQLGWANWNIREDQIHINQTE